MKTCKIKSFPTTKQIPRGIEPTHGDPIGLLVYRFKFNHLAIATDVGLGTLKDNQRDKTAFCSVTTARGPVCVTARLQWSLR